MENRIDVAVIDSGASLSENVIENYSVVDDDLKDKIGHGTAMINYMVEKCPDIKIISIKATRDDGTCTVDDIIKAMKIAIDKNVKIINLSICARKSEVTIKLNDYITQAKEKGIIVVGSAGNYGMDCKDFVPGCCEDAVIVTTDKDRHNYGDNCVIIEANSTSEAAAKYTASILNRGK